MAKKGLDGPPLTIRLKAEEVAAIVAIAASEERDVSEIHRKLIREALAARGLRPWDPGPPGVQTEHTPPGGAIPRSRPTAAGKAKR